jgi:3-hydroxyacyl-[acyl-carrier-protein] dehydratase
MTEVIVPEDIDILEILRLLPHRYPFVMVDRILSVEVPFKSVTGLKNVTINEPCFQGHFPERPIMPAVLILEGMAQTGGIMAFYSVPENIGNKLLYFVGIDKARFRKPVIPGDQIIFKLEVSRYKRGIIVMTGEAHVDGKLVAEAELMATFG